MGTNHGTTVGRLAKGSLGAEVVYAVREYSEGSQHFCDCVNPHTGSMYQRCLVTGIDAKPMGVPRAGWTTGSDLLTFPQVLILHLPDRGTPVVLDRLVHDQIEFKDQPPTTTPGEDETEVETGSSNVDDDQPPQVADRVIKNGGTAVTVRENGDVTINASGTVSILLNGNVMRVSDGGDADGRPLLADPAVTKINELIAAFEAFKAALNTAMVGVTTAMVPGVTTATLANVAQVSSAITTVVVGSATVEPADITAMQSASVLLPSITGA